MTFISTKTGKELHPITRARERLGKEFGFSDLNRIAGLIMRGKTVLMGTCSVRGTQTHLVQYDGATFRVVFDPDTKFIVTFPGTGFKLPKGNYKKRKSGKMKRGR